MTAAVWLLMDEEVGWRLVIASPEVTRVGGREFYGTIYDHWRPMDDPDLSFSVIAVVPPDDPTVARLRRVLQGVVGPGLSELRFTGNVIDGVLIPDALIYRVS